MAESGTPSIPGLIGFDNGSVLSSGDSQAQDELSLNFFDLVVLSMLESVPMTGYVIKKRLFVQYRLKVSYGTLYPRLRYLEERGIIRNSNVAGEFAARKSGTNYGLTRDGKKVLDRNLRTFQGFLGRIDRNPIRTATSSNSGRG